jgi:hypothetical protein
LGVEEKEELNIEERICSFSFLYPPCDLDSRRFVLQPILFRYDPICKRGKYRIFIGVTLYFRGFFAMPETHFSSR